MPSKLLYYHRCIKCSTEWRCIKRFRNVTISCWSLTVNSSSSRKYRKHIKPSRSVLWDFTHTSGGREGGREQGQTATTNNGKTGETAKAEQAGGAHNKQAEQRQGNGGRGKTAHRTQPWQAEEQERKAKHATKQRDNWSRTAKGRNKRTPQQGERGDRVGGWEVGEERGQEKDRKRKCAHCTHWTHLGEWKVHPPILLYPRSQRTGGEEGEWGQDHTLGRWEYYFALWLLLPYGYFAHRAASPYGLPIFPRWTWNVHLNIQNSLALEVQTASRVSATATSLSNLGKISGHHFHPSRDVETVQPSEVGYPWTHWMRKVMERCKDVVFDASKSQFLGNHPERAKGSTVQLVNLIESEWT